VVSSDGISIGLRYLKSPTFRGCQCHPKVQYSGPLGTPERLGRYVSAILMTE